MRIITSLTALFMLAGMLPAIADGQPPLPGAKQETLPRLPDDQIEGTIWEYKGTLDGKPKEGEEPPTLEGRFRTEGKAIFDVSKTLPLPKKKDVEKAVESVKKGEVGEVKLPPGPQVKRLGQYRTISGTRLRLDFDDKDSLHGIMIIRPKKQTEDVWIGTYTEKQGTKTVRIWNVEVRPIED